MKHRGRVETTGAVELPEHRQRGSYPPDIARRRRQLHLPVTPEEHIRYDHGESDEPPVTNAQMLTTLREVLPRCRPGPFRQALLEVAARLRARNREPGEEG
jgi:hypothetical protein